MKKRVVTILLAAGLAALAALTALTLPASAEQRTLTVRLVSGQVVTMTVDVPPGVPLSAIKLPGVLEILPSGTPTTPPPTSTGPAATSPAEPAPKPGAGTRQPSGGKRGTATKPKAKTKRRPSKKGAGNGSNPRRGTDGQGGNTGGARAKKRLRNSDGTPTPANPGFVDALPGPAVTRGVPNFVIEKFRVPPFLLPIYQAAGIQYGVRWEILAAINEIETDYGRNLNVSSAGALGWMQFIPSTWRSYGVDANKDGRKDPYNPVDAIFAAARYLKAAGYGKDVRRAIFAYNNANWYVDSVLLRARLIAGVPADLIGSLTGLTEGRFPVAARARYADDLAEAQATKRVKRGQNAANVVSSSSSRRSVEIFAAQGSPVVATNDGQIKKVGTSRSLGRYITLQDVYGNRYTYAHLGSVARYYPVPKADASNPKGSAKAIAANASKSDPRPARPASAGTQPEPRRSRTAARRPVKPARTAPSSAASVPVKRRLFANPSLPGARESGGLEQLLDAKAAKNGGFELYRNYFSRPFGVSSKDVRLRPLKAGSRVIGGTILGRVAKPGGGRASHMAFSIRPAGKGAPAIDPKPILDGWKLLEATAIYRASGRNVLYGNGADGLSIGQVLLLPQPLLEKRVLSDSRIDIYPGGRSDIKAGQINRRVLATMEYLAASGLRPQISSLKSGHSYLTVSGNVSQHSSGNALDISSINGVALIGAQQQAGGLADQVVRRLMRLQGTMRPDQIISLLDYGGNTLAMADHNNHVHVGFRPLLGDNRKLGAQALAVLKPGQWSDLLARLRKIENPVVPTKPSKYAIPTKPKKRNASD